MILHAGFFLKPENMFYSLCDSLSFPEKSGTFFFSGIGSIKCTLSILCSRLYLIPKNWKLVAPCTWEKLNFETCTHRRAKTLGNRFDFNSIFTKMLRGGGGYLSKFSKETPKSYHIGCGSSQFYSLKVTSEIFIHRNNTGILKIIAKGQQVLL